MKKNTILLLTLLLFILLLNGFAAKDARIELTQSLKEFKKEVQEKLITLESELVQKDDQLIELKGQLRNKEMLLDEIKNQINVISSTNSSLSNYYNHSLITGLEKNKILPSINRPKNEVLTR